MDNKGFTLIEILIVLGIMALLTTMAVIYTQAGQNQIALSIEESKVAQLILEARELSIATYSTNSRACAYGVYFDYPSSTYSLFEYNSAVSSAQYAGRPVCPSIASTTATDGLEEAIDAGDLGEYANGSWQVHTAQGVVLDDLGAASGTLQAVLFYPPDPFTLVSTDGATFLYPAPTAYVYLSTTDGSASRTITVNPVGQVNL